MSLKQMKQVPLKTVPIFGPIYSQLESIAAAMTKERRVLETADGPPEEPVNVVQLINSTLAQAVGEWQKSRQIKKEGESPIKIVGGDVAQKIKEGKLAGPRR